MNGRNTLLLLAGFFLAFFATWKLNTQDSKITGELFIYSARGPRIKGDGIYVYLLTKEQSKRIQLAEEELAEQIRGAPGLRGEWWLPVPTHFDWFFDKSIVPFEWTARVMGDEAGRFEFKVPYYIKEPLFLFAQVNFTNSKGVERNCYWRVAVPHIPGDKVVKLWDGNCEYPLLER